MEQQNAPIDLAIIWLREYRAHENRHGGVVKRMAEKETAGTRLLNLLQRLPEWSSSLDAIRIRILAEAIASLYRQIMDGFSVDEDLLTEITDVPESWDLDSLPREARAQLAKMGRIIEAPRAFVLGHSGDSLFESLIRQLAQMEKRVNLAMGPSAWSLYTLLHELEARSRSMSPEQLMETERVIRGIHLRVLSSLSPDLSTLEMVTAIEGWFEALPEEHRVYAARIIALCNDSCEHTAIFLQERLPAEMTEARFRMEAARASNLLLEVATMAP